MRNLETLNIDESIKKERLIMKEGWKNTFINLFLYYISSIFVTGPFLTYFNPYRKNPEDNIDYLILLAFPVLIGIYVIYRKATEKKLFKIPTNFNRKYNRQLLLEYAQKKTLKFTWIQMIV